MRNTIKISKIIRKDLGVSLRFIGESRSKEQLVVIIRHL
jgi:hypothetical protein